MSNELTPDDLRAYALEHFSHEKATHICHQATAWEADKQRIAELEADANRWRLVRYHNLGYLFEEEGVRGGKDLDDCIDDWIRYCHEGQLPKVKA